MLKAIDDFISEWMSKSPPLIDEKKEMAERNAGDWLTYRKAKAYPPGRGPEKYWDDLKEAAQVKKA